MRHCELWKEVSEKKSSASSPIHGLTHWRRVFENGLIIAKETGANIELVELFALFHDSCRLNDGKDPYHGRRAADGVASMRSTLPGLPEDLFQFLLEALRDHTHVQHTDNIHIATCWDADRLDLGRVGVTPKEEFMNTDIGRMIAVKAARMLAEYVQSKIDIKNATLGDEYFYQSLPLCVIDAVYSLNANYQGTRATVMRYCDFYNVQRLRLDKEVIPPRNEQQTLSSLIEKIEERGYKYFAEQVIFNRQRTSTRNGILKADAVYRFAKKLIEYGVECLQDVGKVAANANFDSDIRAIPGQTAGISLNYFFMLAGSEELIKPDRHILAFIKDGIGRTVSIAEAQPLLGIACKLLQTDFPRLTLRLLDNTIWDYQRRMVKKIRNNVCKPNETEPALAVKENWRNGMNEDEVKNYVRRLIDGHKNRRVPKGEDSLQAKQKYLYEIVKKIFIETGDKNISIKEVKDKFGEGDMPLLSDFCYNLVNVGPDFEGKFLVRIQTGKYKFMDFQWSAEERIEKITWSPKGRNVPSELKGSDFKVGEYFKGKYNWDFREIENYLE